MDFYDVIKCCGPDTIEKRRVFESTFAELLIRNENIASWHAGCETFLGSPMDHSNPSESERITAISKDYGGVRSGQTVFAKEEYGSRLIVMFWPWAKGPYTTVRMGLTEVPSPAETKALPQPEPRQATPTCKTQTEANVSHRRIVSFGDHFSQTISSHFCRGFGVKPHQDGAATEPTKHENCSRVIALEDEIRGLKAIIADMRSKLDALRNQWPEAVS